MTRKRTSGRRNGDDSHARLMSAARLYERFTGSPGEVVARVKSTRVRGWPLTTEKKVALIPFGTLDYVGYTTRRKGRVEKYHHDFASHARPLLVASFDGQRGLYILGGEYRFTGRGIVDSRKR